MLNNTSYKMASVTSKASATSNASVTSNAQAQSASENEIDPDNYIEEPHIIIDSCFRGKHLKRLVEHQIESYNDFIQFQVPRTIAMFNPIHICSEQDLDKAVNKYRLEMFVTCENFNIFRAQIHEINGNQYNRTE